MLAGGPGGAVDAGGLRAGELAAVDVFDWPVVLAGRGYTDAMVSDVKATGRYQSTYWQRRRGLPMELLVIPHPPLGRVDAELPRQRRQRRVGVDGGMDRPVGARVVCGT